MRPPTRAIVLGTLAALLASACTQVGPDALHDSPTLVPSWHVSDSLSRAPETECHVHGIPLVEGAVPLSYGFPSSAQALLSAREARFPLARELISAGCVVRATTHTRVRYCPECRDAEASWRRQHDMDWIHGSWLGSLPAF